MPESPTVLIMAAGHGTRMRSALPKVLHPVCGKPMVGWVIDAARQAGAGEVLCVVRPGSGVEEGVGDRAGVVEQQSGEGTGAAVLAARDRLSAAAAVVVLSGDVPLMGADVIAELLATHEREHAAATLLTTEELDPTGYGRIVRGPDGSVERIAETKDPSAAAPDELAVREVNVGAYVFAAETLVAALDEVGEIGDERYLTGVFPLLRQAGHRIATHRTTDTSTAMGVNDLVGLMEVQELARRRILERHATAGVTFEAPGSAYVEADVEIGADSVIGPGVTLRGATRIGTDCRVGPHATAIDASIGDGASVLHAHLVECEVGPRASVGPFAYLRPGTVLGEGAKVGTFVEVKNSAIGAGAKVPHLSYLGDADVGEGANVAAGNITANYDGRSKHRTTIGEGARTGVDTSFVAPVTVGDGAYTAAGSVIVEDVPPGALGIARAKQQNVEGYAERVEGDSPE